MAEPLRELFSVRVTGPKVTEEVTRDVGEAAVELFDAVAESQGLPRGLVSVGEVRVACDAEGCREHRPWPSEAPGWVRTADGHDYCPAHAATVKEVGP